MFINKLDLNALFCNYMDVQMIETLKERLKLHFSCHLGDLKTSQLK